MTSPKTVFMFPGQGSQYFQMGEALYKQHPQFRSCMRDMDEIVRELCSYSALQLLYEQGYTRSETFDRALLSHPAIFMVQYATAQLLIDADIVPDLTIGTSIGCFAAAVIAGSMSMEEALIAIIRQASTLEARCPKGGMLAVLQDPEQFRQDDLSRESEIACFNLPTHIVLSARQEPLKRIEQELRTRGATLQKLPVSFAFHSQWIDEARDAFQRFMRSVTLSPSRIPMMCTLTSQLMTSLPEDYFWRAVREPVRFYDAVKNLESNGSYRYIDVGPSSTLSTIVKHTLTGASTSTARATLTPFGYDLRNISAVIEDNE